MDSNQPLSVTTYDRHKFDPSMLAKLYNFSESIIEVHELSRMADFNALISNEVMRMRLMKKHICDRAMKVHDTNVIYSQSIGLHASEKQVDTDYALKCKLAPVPMQC